VVDEVGANGGDEMDMRVIVLASLLVLGKRSLHPMMIIIVYL